MALDVWKIKSDTVTLVRSANFSVLQFPYLENGYNTWHFIGFLRFKGVNVVYVLMTVLSTENVIP